MLIQKALSDIQFLFMFISLSESKGRIIIKWNSSEKFRLVGGFHELNQHKIFDSQMLLVGERVRESLERVLCIAAKFACTGTPP